MTATGCFSTGTACVVIKKCHTDSRFLTESLSFQRSVRVFPHKSFHFSDFTLVKSNPCGNLTVEDRFVTATGCFIKAEGCFIKAEGCFSRAKGRVELFLQKRLCLTKTAMPSSQNRLWRPLGFVGSENRFGGF